VGPTITACLIVRDEAVRIAECVAAIDPFVDEVLVADTGSQDETVVRAADAGATVITVPWSDDFAAARNTALAACRTDWVLSVDADELAVGDPASLRAVLARTSAVALSVEIHELGADNPRGQDRHRAVKLFRPDACRWQGRVHEEVVALSGELLGTEPLSAPALTLRHSGYADPAVFAAKIARNLRLARLAADQLGPDAVPERRLAVLLDLGRTELAAGERENGTATLQTVRRRATAGGPAWVWATDFLAWDAANHQDVDLAWELLGELADHDADAGQVRPLAERLLDL
jgi:hypothetical protein